MSKRSQTRVVVAMSGGVDSSVAAALMAQAGYETIGVTLRLYKAGAINKRAGTCCAGRDIYDARRVADSLGIPHYVLDYENRFRTAVIEDFADGYLRGETPIPCIKCNQQIKFSELLQTARDLGADALVTGHYVRTKFGPEGIELHRGVDTSRDQSYFLFSTTHEQLSCLWFPLGQMMKNETRDLATRFGLQVATKRESQDICFVTNGRYSELVKGIRPHAVKGGEIVNLKGQVLGHHTGVFNYTIGQRRRIGLQNRHGEGAPLYVVRIEPTKRRIVVGPRKALLESNIVLRGVNWLGLENKLNTGVNLTVKIRSASLVVPATVQGDCDKTARVTFWEPQEAIAPGQACVFYEGTRVLGGGWIDKIGPGAQSV